MTLVSLELPKIQDLIINLPVWIAGKMIPTVSIPTIPKTVNGLWSLWKVSLDSKAMNSRQETFFAVYTDQIDKSYPATAKRIWDALLSNQAIGLKTPNASIQTVIRSDLDNVILFEKQQQQAIDIGTTVFNALKDRHSESLVQEKEKADYAFSARRRAIERIGLPEVRNHRLQALDQELKEWKITFDEPQSIMPDLQAVLLLRVMPDMESLGV